MLNFRVTANVEPYHIPALDGARHVHSELLDVHYHVDLEQVDVWLKECSKVILVGYGLCGNGVTEWLMILSCPCLADVSRDLVSFRHTLQLFNGAISQFADNVSSDSALFRVLEQRPFTGRVPRAGSPLELEKTSGIPPLYTPPRLQSSSIAPSDKHTIRTVSWPTCLHIEGEDLGKRLVRVGVFGDVVFGRQLAIL